MTFNEYVFDMLVDYSHKWIVIMIIGWGQEKSVIGY